MSRLICTLAISLFIATGIHAQSLREWQFNVYLDDVEIGSHKVSVFFEKNQQRVSVNANFNVKFLFFTVYRYRHKTEEIWQQGCLTDIKAQTNDNGDVLFIKKLDHHEGFKVKTHRGEQTFNGCVRSFAYWNLDLLKSEKLLNTQTGDYESVKLIKIGDSPILYKNKSTEAIQYRLVAGKKIISLWYDKQTNEWLALQSETEDGYLLSYYAKHLES